MVELGKVEFQRVGWVILQFSEDKVQDSIEIIIENGIMIGLVIVLWLCLVKYLWFEGFDYGVENVKSVEFGFFFVEQVLEDIKNWFNLVVCDDFFCGVRNDCGEKMCVCWYIFVCFLKWWVEQRIEEFFVIFRNCFSRI